MVLYKKDNNSNIRFLLIEIRGDELSQTSGILHTENPMTHSKVCKGKNIGKKNETTGVEQAQKEKESLIAEKLKEGYFRTIEEAKIEETLFPMLAKDYNKEKKKIDWSKDTYVQPKLDGMRCLITVTLNGVSMKSRDGRTIETMHHIAESFNGVPHGTYDGELYYHGKTFQENMEFIKKWRDGSENVKFHCYDTVVNDAFKRRLLVRDTNLSEVNNVVFVKTYKIKNEAELIKYHKEFIEEGYEGSIVRHGEEPYKINGRSSNLLKYKDFQDIVAEIIDIEPAEQRPEWGVPVLKYSVQKLSGVSECIFRAGMKYSHDARKEFLINKVNYIGKTAEIRFFEWTDEGIPRFPVMVGIRLDK